MYEYYPDPIDQLSRLGEPAMNDWIDYTRHGVGSEDLPYLTEMIQDPVFEHLDIDDPEVQGLQWAPIHALRAMAELGDPRAIELLLTATITHPSDEWIANGVTWGLTLIGPEAIPACARVLLHPGLPDHPRWVTSEALERIGTVYPEARQACVEAILEPFRHPDWFSPGYLSFLLLPLAQLEATDALPFLRTCYEAGTISHRDYPAWDDVVGEFDDGPRPVEPLLVEGEPWPRDVPLYRIKITLRGIDPPIWRLIELPGDASLSRLHQVIQTAFDWLDYHLHEFHSASGRFVLPEYDIDWEPDPDARDTREHRLVDVAPDAPVSLVYRYDFGDDWGHEVDVLEIVDEPYQRHELPRCLDGARAAPPEDCGGITGYQKMLAALADPTDPEHREWKQWAGDYDPDRFDLEAANRRMRGPELPS